VFVKRSPKATAPMRVATDDSSVSMIGSENVTWPAWKALCAHNIPAVPTTASA
jgi:hypothetical protein